jgi:23S rRNA pseudouridine2457 synthase
LKKYSYYIINKPFGVLTSFTDKEGRPVLGNLFKFPKNVYPVGRLDKDSEGMLLLTDDRALNHYLLNPRFHHEREYLVQVEGIPTSQAMKMLETGVVIEGIKTLPAKAKLLKIPPDIEERIPPIRKRLTVPTSWITLTLYEGRNRQVRKMTAKAGYPTLRLIRIRIGGLTLDSLAPGKVKELTEAEVNLLISNKSN